MLGRDLLTLVNPAYIHWLTDSEVPWLEEEGIGNLSSRPGALHRTRADAARCIRSHCALTRRNNDIGCHSANDLAIVHERGHLSAYTRKERVLDFLPESGNTG